MQLGQLTVLGYGLFSFPPSLPPFLPSETGSHCVTKPGPELVILLFQTPERWDYRCALPCVCVCVCVCVYCFVTMGLVTCLQTP
jgi:hypothetical protein